MVAGNGSKWREAPPPEEGILPGGPVSRDAGAVAEAFADGPLMISRSSAIYYQLDVLQGDSLLTYLQKLVLQESA